MKVPVYQFEVEYKHKHGACKGETGASCHTDNFSVAGRF